MLLVIKLRLFHATWNKGDIVEKKWFIDVPVVFVIFNRYDTAKMVFSQIKKARPRQLFVVSDGARPDRIGENDQVNKTREIIKDIDWECEVYTNFSDINMGCDKRIETGITWAFQYVDRVIILEDDCYPTVQFFEFCAAMLKKYINEPQIAYISGSLSIKGFKTQYDYFYSYYGDTWGWATWRDRWQKFEYGTEDFYKKREKYMKDIFSEKARMSFLRDVEGHFKRGSFPWDYIWLINVSNLLKIVPSVNLTKNIGFSNESTHTVSKPKGYYDELGELSEEYTYPDKIENNMKYIKHYEKETEYRFWDRVVGKLRSKKCFIHD